MITYDDIIQKLKPDYLFSKEVAYRSTVSLDLKWKEHEKTVTGLSMFCTGMLVGYYVSEIINILEGWPVKVEGDTCKEQITITIL